eukprot:2553056-Ditylum_brightwellii.AAC.1
MLYYVTDGGADNKIGYFGWVIATDTRIITKGYGQAQGNEHQMRQQKEVNITFDLASTTEYNSRQLGNKSKI